MKKNKKTGEKDEAVEQQIADNEYDPNSEEHTNEENVDCENDSLNALKAQLDEKSNQCSEYLTMLQRTAAEFDNYKKRTAREKETIYSDAVSDVILAFLPIIDNLDRAIQSSSNDNDAQSLREGVQMVFRQLIDTMKKLGVEEIESIGKSFNPELHNAVMHIEDDSYDENIVVEEFQKGYTLKDKVIRHSMVKVAN
jgi:molecular chaperone GrpE